MTLKWWKQNLVFIQGPCLLPREAFQVQTCSVHGVISHLKSEKEKNMGGQR